MGKTCGSGFRGKLGVQLLDNVVGELGLRQVDFIKIDCEGYELFVVKGGEVADVEVLAAKLPGA